MNKKQLFEEINFLLRQNKELYEKYNALLSKDNSETNTLSEKLELLAKENEALKAEINELKNSPAEAPKTEEKNEETEKPLEKIETEEKEPKTTEPKNVYENITPVSGEIAGNKDLNIDFASKTIGDAVVLCAKVCAELKNYAPNVSKDLVNLALGKTELFKNEIMEIVLSGADTDLLTAQINTKLSELKEYFELLKHQN